MESRYLGYTGSILSHPQLARGVTLGVAPLPRAQQPPAAAAAPSPPKLRMRGTLKPPDPVAALAASLRMEPRSIALAPSAFLHTQARIRGPMYWHLRPGERPHEAVDLAAHLEEQAPPPSCAEGETQIDHLLPAAPEPTWAQRHMKSGVDAASQVAHGSRARRQRSRSIGGGSSSGGGGSGSDALFDFDAACAPLATRVSRDVLAQALEELQREADLLALARRRGQVQGALDADAADAASAVAATARVAARGAGKLAAARAAYAAQQSALSKVSACAMAGGAVRGALAAAKARIRLQDGFVNSQALHARTVILPEAYARLSAALGEGGGESGARAAAQGLLAGAVAEALRKSRSDRAAVEAAARRAEEGKLRYAIRVFVRLPRTFTDLEGERHLPKNFTLPGEDVVDVMDEECMPSHHAVDKAALLVAMGSGGEEAAAAAAAAAAQAAAETPAAAEIAAEGAAAAPGATTDGGVSAALDAAPQAAAADAAAAAADAPAPPSSTEDAALRPTTAQLRPTTADASAFHVQYYRTVLVGPISVARYDSVGAVEASIAEWLSRVNSRHVRRINAMAAGAALALHLGGRRLPVGSVLLGAEERVSLAGLELRPLAADGESSVQWDVSVREEALPSREELGLGPLKEFNRDGSGEGGEGEEGGGDGGGSEE
jgi:hypothetical protein